LLAPPLGRAETMKEECQAVRVAHVPFGVRYGVWLFRWLWPFLPRFQRGGFFWANT
jgi:hypothetical protein